jgi:hypothetical protein
VGSGEWGVGSEGRYRAWGEHPIDTQWMVSVAQAAFRLSAQAEVLPTRSDLFLLWGGHLARLSSCEVGILWGGHLARPIIHCSRSKSSNAES